jgi:hypothetical protein
MNKNDTQKLLRAGYRFIRSDKHILIIKIQSRGSFSHGWKTLEKGFKTIKELDQRMTELLLDDKILEL